ncbi:MAG: hypothetical protein JXA60_08080 [Candidatus Coatesbacteria bacterium]|nr:hypothetical protein [Candidatus Coatesbacteria bacterium]
MDLELVEIKVWCMGCRQQLEIEQAALVGWKYCGNCHHFICPECLSIIGSRKACLSDRCREEGLMMDIQDIPLAKITLFARSQLTELPEDSLLYKLFYKKEELLAKDKTKPIENEVADIFIQTAEEVWKNKRIVLAKRRRGRFISWQNLGKES